jgi:hypothetical protein
MWEWILQLRIRLGSLIMNRPVLEKAMMKRMRQFGLPLRDWKFSAYTK